MCKMPNTCVKRQLNTTAIKSSLKKKWFWIVKTLDSDEVVKPYSKIESKELY